ncbi:unnamed protein product [Strongylus vulgaris]|uniref:Uncharacterized protein n=1 Tax=Strongylus vulgaris TaxID=40348 RepID=A0A3P7JMW1_STRVU|nr:unnamed protein product [Strongylus vulgaris]
MGKAIERESHKRPCRRLSYELAGAGGTEQFTIHLAFGDIPYIVLGAKGVGRTAAFVLHHLLYFEADSNSAWNLLSFFQGFLSRPTMQTLRKKWANADSEIEEIVQVCRMVEDAMNSEQYNQLRTQAQMSVTSKRKLSYDAITDTDSDVPVPKKKNKACQAVALGNGHLELDWADEYDEDGLHYTYISPMSSSGRFLFFCLREKFREHFPVFTV